MKHTIITWDCSYRAFHHLIDALAGQEYPTSEWELVYVEQRTKRYSNAHNRKQGLPSLWDRYLESKDEINMRVVYVGTKADAPYHLGLCVNAGLEAAQGDIVSVMDGDQLLLSRFLSTLTGFHDSFKVGYSGIACQHCHVASAPAGVTEENWTEASFDFDEVLALCPYGHDPYPSTVKPGSYGSMVSTERKHWEAINGLDVHPIWSTSASMVLSDAAHRLERLLDTKAQVLQGMFSVHPWHPHGYGRRGRAEGNEKVGAYLALQRELMKSTEYCDWQYRTSVANELYEANKRLVNGVHKAELGMMRG